MIRPELEGKMHDNGEREYSKTGGAREPAIGKGRYDLISPIGLMRLINYVPQETELQAIEEDKMTEIDSVIKHILEYRIGNRQSDHLAAACYFLNKFIHTQKYPDVKPALYVYFNRVSPHMLKRLADWYELGAIKYDDRNWEKGLSWSRCLDSAQRHLNKYFLHETDEDHLIAVIWNLFAIMHYETCGLSQFNDIPMYPITENRKPSAKELAALELYLQKYKSTDESGTDYILEDTGDDPMVEEDNNE